MLLSPFGYTAYRGTHGDAIEASQTKINSTYFIGPGREAGGKSELLTISTISFNSNSGVHNETIPKDDCDKVTIPDYPLGERSGYNMEVRLEYCYYVICKDVLFIKTIKTISFIIYDS